MKHLTIDEILNFVSLTELNSESIELSATVNGHIRKCEKCLKLVGAFQMVYDEFSRLNIGVSFKDSIIENFSEMKNEDMKNIEIDNVLDEIDRFR